MRNIYVLEFGASCIRDLMVVLFVENIYSELFALGAIASDLGREVNKLLGKHV